MIETGFARNVKHIQPVIGLMLVVSIGIFVLHIVRSSMEDLATSFQASHLDETRSSVTGTLLLDFKQPVGYGDLVAYRTTLVGHTPGEGHAYVTTTCFQDEKLVYQLSGEQKTRFLLVDLREPQYYWNGGPAFCHGSLMYRAFGGASAGIHLLDSKSFAVHGSR
jgi:hypothetical protein